MREIFRILDNNLPLYDGFIRLLPEHYNTSVYKPGFKRIFSKHTGGNIIHYIYLEMIGFLKPAFDLDDPDEWEKAMKQYS